MAPSDGSASSGRFVGATSLAGGLATTGGFGVMLARLDVDEGAWIDDAAVLAFVLGAVVLLCSIVGLYEVFALREETVGVVALGSVLVGLLVLLGLSAAFTYAFVLVGVLLLGLALRRRRAISRLGAAAFMFPMAATLSAYAVYSGERTAYVSGVALGVPFIVAGVELLIRGGGRRVRTWTLGAVAATAFITAATIATFGLASLLAPLAAATAIVAARRDGTRSVLWWVAAVTDVWLLVVFCVVVLALL